MDVERRYLTPSEAAAELRVSTDTVLRLIASGDLAGLRVSARIIRIPVPAFKAFQAGHGPARRVVIRRQRSTEAVIGAGEPTPQPQTA